MISPPSQGQALIFVCQQWHAISCRGTGAKTQVLILSTLMALMVWRMRESACHWKCNALYGTTSWTRGRNMMFICFYGELYWRSTVNIAQTEREYANKNILRKTFFFCIDKQTRSKSLLIVCWTILKLDFLCVFLPWYIMCFHLLLLLLWET